MKEGVKVSAQEAAKIEEKTREQGGSDQWKLEREWRLTASNFGDICKVTDRRDIEKFCESMYNSKNLDHVPSVRHGQTYESIALEKFTEVTGKDIIKSGFCVHPDFPYLGASPDGFVGDDAVAEVKCPYRIRNSKIEPENVDFLEWNGDKMRLKRTHKYYYQVVGQMKLSKRSQAFFIVYTFKDFFYEQIVLDEEFFKNMVTTLKDFYDQHYCPYVASIIKK